MKMVSHLLVVGILALVTAAPGRADAATAFRITGNTCVPIDTTIQADRYTVGAASVQLKPTTAATAIFMCPISFFIDTSWTDFDMYYADGGGYTSVTVYLRELTLGSSTASTIYTCTSINGTSSRNCDFTDFTISNSKIYWFEVQLHRDGTTDAAELIALALNG